MKVDKVTPHRSNDGQFVSYLHGASEASNLVVLVPGMLYDTERPPGYCILTSVRERLGKSALTLMASRTVRHDDDIYEIPPTQQADRIQIAINEALSEHHSIRNVSFVSHSVGALAVRKVARERFMASTSDSLLLTPPSPRKHAVAQIQDCLSRIMPVDSRRSTQTRTVYLSRENVNFIVERDVWSNIDELDHTVDPNQEVDYVVALRDRVFPDAYSAIYSQSPDRTILLDDTHSLKDPRSVDIVSTFILQKMLH